MEHWSGSFFSQFFEIFHLFALVDPLDLFNFFVFKKQNQSILIIFELCSTLTLTNNIVIRLDFFPPVQFKFMLH